ncbi:MAG: RNase P subunit [Thermoproteota archaeon]|nr:RNase P subunit [Thermoproteota archaeon]
MSRKKQKVKQIAREHIDLLVEYALHEKDDHLAAKLARQAKKIAMHQRIRLPYEIRQFYCKRCKAFIVPGRSARVRVGRAKTKAVRITCLKCGHTYHKILIWNKDL